MAAVDSNQSSQAAATSTSNKEADIASDSSVPVDYEYKKTAVAAYVETGASATYMAWALDLPNKEVFESWVSELEMDPEAGDSMAPDQRQIFINRLLGVPDMFVPAERSFLMPDGSVLTIATNEQKRQSLMWTAQERRQRQLDEEDAEQLQLEKEQLYLEAKCAADDETDMEQAYRLFKHCEWTCAQLMKKYDQPKHIIDNWLKDDVSERKRSYDQSQPVNTQTVTNQHKRTKMDDESLSSASGAAAGGYERKQGQDIGAMSFKQRVQYTHQKHNEGQSIEQLMATQARSKHSIIRHLTQFDANGNRKLTRDVSSSERANEDNGDACNSLDEDSTLEEDEYNTDNTKNGSERSVSLGMSSTTSNAALHTAGREQSSTSTMLTPTTESIAVGESASAQLMMDNVLTNTHKRTRTLQEQLLERTAILHKQSMGQSLTEISRSMGMHPKTVKRRLAMHVPASASSEDHDQQTVALPPTEQLPSANNASTSYSWLPIERDVPQMTSVTGDVLTKRPAANTTHLSNHSQTGRRSTRSQYNPVDLMELDVNGEPTTVPTAPNNQAVCYIRAHSATDSDSHASMPPVLGTVPDTEALSAVTIGPNIQQQPISAEHTHHTLIQQHSTPNAHHETDRNEEEEATPLMHEDDKPAMGDHVDQYQPQPLQHENSPKESAGLLGIDVEAEPVDAEQLGSVDSAPPSVTPPTAAIRAQFETFTPAMKMNGGFDDEHVETSPPDMHMEEGEDESPLSGQVRVCAPVVRRQPVYMEEEEAVVSSDQTSDVSSVTVPDSALGHRQRALDHNTQAEHLCVGKATAGGKYSREQKQNAVQFMMQHRPQMTYKECSHVLHIPIRTLASWKKHAEAGAENGETETNTADTMQEGNEIEQQYYD